MASNMVVVGRIHMDILQTAHLGRLTVVLRLRLRISRQECMVVLNLLLVRSQEALTTANSAAREAVLMASHKASTDLKHPGRLAMDSQARVSSRASTDSITLVHSNLAMGSKAPVLAATQVRKAIHKDRSLAATMRLKASTSQDRPTHLADMVNSQDTTNKAASMASNPTPVNLTAATSTTIIRTLSIKLTTRMGSRGDTEVSKDMAGNSTDHTRQMLAGSDSK